MLFTNWNSFHSVVVLLTSWRSNKNWFSRWTSRYFMESTRARSRSKSILFLWKLNFVQLSFLNSFNDALKSRISFLHCSYSFSVKARSSIEARCAVLKREGILLTKLFIVSDGISSLLYDKILLWFDPKDCSTGLPNLPFSFIYIS